LTFLGKIFQSQPYYILPAPAYILLYLLDLIVFAYGLRLIARKTFAFSAYTYTFALLAFPDIVLYPTDRSSINIIATGSFFYDRYMEVIDKAFTVTSIGFFILVFTIRYCSKYVRFCKMRFFGKAIRTSLFSDSFALTLIVIEVVLLALLVANGVKLTSARDSGFADTAVRPFVVVSTYMVQFALTIFLARLFLNVSPKNIFFVAVTSLFAVTLGARSAIFLPLTYYIFLIAWWRKSTNILVYLISAIILFALVHLADVLRSSSTSGSGLSLVSFIASIFYGNSFSDLRDFSWIMSNWDGTLLLGRTYLAGFLGFIPSFLFPLRQEWNLGPETLRLSGLYVSDPTHIHPGLRGTYLAEAYLNFGSFGVLAISIFVGWFFLYDYGEVTAAIQRGDKAEFATRVLRYEIVMAFVLCVYNTSDLSYGYFMICMFVLAAVLRKA
jgi:hypothetical protein